MLCKTGIKILLIQRWSKLIFKMKNISTTKAIVVVLCLFCPFVSCSDPDVEALRQRVNNEYELTAEDLATGSKFSKVQYKEIELAYNQKYIEDLKELLNNSFEKQLEAFEDGELGFWATYSHSFSYIFQSRQTREDKMRVKTQKYFNTLDVEQEAQELFLLYKKDVENLRARYANTMFPGQKMPSLDLPKSQIDLVDMDEYSGNNIIIDIFAEIAIWIAILLILFILGFIFGVLGLGMPPISIPSWIVVVITIIVSIILSIHNDNKLLDALREQNTTEITQDYDAILDELNNNTIKFYDKI